MCLHHMTFGDGTFHRTNADALAPLFFLNALEHLDLCSSSYPTAVSDEFLLELAQVLARDPVPAVLVAVVERARRFESEYRANPGFTVRCPLDSYMRWSPEDQRKPRPSRRFRLVSQHGFIRPPNVTNFWKDRWMMDLPAEPEERAVESSMNARWSTSLALGQVRRQDRRESGLPMMDTEVRCRVGTVRVASSGPDAKPSTAGVTINVDYMNPCPRFITLIKKAFFSLQSLIVTSVNFASGGYSQCFRLWNLEVDGLNDDYSLHSH
ncbi:hypothetical protein C8Q74DRAFT_1215017 [Fomes fomentarius]|nr:hypothetical protein C8Q74DRAFT_1215017 [Fomes fomentarius]